MGTDRTSAPKQRDLGPSRVRRDTGYLTTQQGVRVDQTDDSLTIGERGPTLLEDFHAERRSPTSTMSAYRSAWFMRAVRALMASSNRMTLGSPNTPRRNF
jgi:hypothetical protein